MTDALWALYLEIISGANITGPTAALIAGNSSAILSCQATAGTITSREWLKDGQPLSPSNTITISGDNSSVSINPVEGSDNGQYQCKLTNPVSTDTVSYTLIVIYGPLDAVILGGDTAAVGSTVVLYCSAPSVPPPAFAWEVNGTQTGVRTAVYVIEMSNNTDSGTYTCLATNDITGLSASARHELTVKAEAPSCPTPALTPAEAAGVTIGVTAGVALLVLAVYFGIRHFRIKSNDSGQETAGNNTERATVQGGEGSSGKPSPKVYRTGARLSKDIQPEGSEHRNADRPGQRSHIHVYENIRRQNLPPPLPPRDMDIQDSAYDKQIK
ncbi:hypothetical protein MATL_G00127130 [Megalops atlanticus]|uniref:Ig-like domain-containing protein n=1 Tax=Megalops atlanticus TaxID=7932 RepID=A0A9D3PZG8_MEGAT|nr:hypothetical protein MATL_G00127130 [Megalops atlanticus]